MSEISDYTLNMQVAGRSAACHRSKYLSHNESAGVLVVEHQLVRGRRSSSSPCRVLLDRNKHVR